MREREKAREVARAGGALLFEDDHIACIATGLGSRPSRNAKTGPMAQVWILARELAPQAAVDSGADARVCFDCPLRGGTCYVLPWREPSQVWHAYRAGSYADLSSEQRPVWARIFDRKRVRFGAYGDPAAVPLWVWKRLSSAADTHTGYTHQWRRLGSAWARYFMASCDSAADLAQARARGWRAFLVQARGALAPAGTVRCPHETHGTQCAECGLCQGTQVRARDVVVSVHGNGATRFEAGL